MDIKIQIKDLLEKYFVLVKRFVPEQIVRPAVGLDIGHHAVKMVAVKPQGNVYELVQWGIEPVVQGDLKQPVEKLLKTLPEPPSSLTTAVSGKGTLVRYIDMPKMGAEDLRRSFALESDKYFPFPKDQIYTDCFILERAEKDNQMSVMVAAAKKELIDQRLELFKALETPPDYIVLDSIALANAFQVLGGVQTEDQGPEVLGPQATAVLDIGQGVSTLTIIVNTLPRFCRDIFIGGHDLTVSIGNGLGLDLDAAEKLKLDPGRKLSEILKITDSIIMNLVSELRLSFDYFITEKNIPIKQLLLTGGASQLEGLSGVFAKSLEMQVKNWHPQDSLALAPSLSKEDFRRASGKLAVATGLALYS